MSDKTTNLVFLNAPPLQKVNPSSRLMPGGRGRVLPAPNLSKPGDLSLKAKVDHLTHRVTALESQLATLLSQKH